MGWRNYVLNRIGKLVSYSKFLTILKIGRILPKTSLFQIDEIMKVERDTDVTVCVIPNYF